MNPPNPQSDLDRLDDVLQSWRVTDGMPPHFSAAVWERIAETRNQPTVRSLLWSALVLGWERLIAKPVGVSACLTLFTVVGLGFGLWHAESYTERTAAAWQQAYVQAVSPTPLPPLP